MRDGVGEKFEFLSYLLAQRDARVDAELAHVPVDGARTLESRLYPLRVASSLGTGLAAESFRGGGLRRQRQPRLAQLEEPLRLEGVEVDHGETEPRAEAAQHVDEVLRDGHLRVE